MNNAPPSCPHCGSQRLISSTSSRRIYINHAGESVPLLTANFGLDRPVIEATANIYTCSCSWQGTGNECETGESNT